MESPVALVGPSTDDEITHCKNVWLLEYDLNEIQKGWTDLQKSAAKAVLGQTPHLSIVVFGREFEVEEKGPRWLSYGLVRLRNISAQIINFQTHSTLIHLTLNVHTYVIEHP